MTGVNLLAGFLYSRGMERSEKIQLFSIATLFFFLLYNQPAALVLYWTMNNIFAIIRGKVFKKIYITEVATHHQPESSFLLELYRSSQYFFHHYYKFMRYILCLCCLYFALIISFNYTVSIAESFIKLFIIGSIIALILYHATQYIKNHYNLVFLRNWLIIIFSIVAPILFFIPSAIMLGEIEAGGGSYIIGGMLFINLLMVVYFPFKNRATAKIKLLDLKLLNIVGLGALLFILSLILFWLPLNIYLSSPQEFLFSNIIQILQKNIAIFVIVITLGAILIIGSPRQIKFILVTLLVGSMLFALVNGICFARQFGTMHAFTFMQPNIVATGWRNIFEFIIFLTVFTAAYIVVKKYLKLILRLVVILNFIFFIRFFWLIYGDVQKIHYNNSGSKDKQQLYQHILNFSPKGKNIVILILDMFPGGFIEPLFRENPQYNADFSGFTWYPNTLSISNLTFFSVPAINAGWDFTPENLNKRRGTFRKKTQEAYDKLFSAMQKNNYRSSCVIPNHYYHNVAKVLKKNDVNTASNVQFILLKDQIKALKSQTVNHKILRNIGLFLITPSFCNKSIYANGTWLVINAAGQLQQVLRNRAFLDSLGRQSSCTEYRNTFKWFHNDLSHGPYLITRAGKVVNEHDNPDGPMPTLKVTLDALVVWIKWLKKNNLYNNTKIILVSDHSNASHEIPRSLLKEKSFVFDKKVRNRLHALLMVKPFNCNKKFSIDSRLMSNADVAAIVATELMHPADLTDQLDPTTQQILHRSLPAYWLGGVWYEREKIFYKKYQVKDSIFESVNWTNFE
jgi:hypothetical protein